MKQAIVVLDVETTGLDPEHDEIIEFGAWRIEEGKEPESLHFLARPRYPVPPKIFKLTGINEDELMSAPDFPEYSLKVQEFLQDAVLVGHNVQFDLDFLTRACSRVFNQTVWDTWPLTRIFFPTLKHYNLTSLVNKLKINAEGKASHRALDDAWMTWQVLEACRQRGLNFDLGLYDQAQGLLEGWRGRGFFDSMQKEIARIFPARAIRTDMVLAEAEGGIFYDDSQAKETIPDSSYWVEDCFSPGGLLESSLPGYESRSGQLKMARGVAEGLSQSHHLVVEAGTGTGKSLAYLIPALWWAKKSNRRVVVATHTIPLQEQLFQKDLPMLKTILPFPFKTVLLKGRGNYICLKRWQALRQNPEQLSPEEKLAFLSVLVWLRETTRGDLQELPQGQNSAKTWAKINAEQDLCLPGKCPYASRCFLLRARKQAEDAQILVINHSLLFSDLKTDFNVLPEYDHLIVDEAHHFYHTALEHLGVSLSREGLERILDSIGRPSGVSFYAVTKHRLEALRERCPGLFWDNFRERLDAIPQLCREISEQCKEIFELLAAVLGESISVRLTAAHREMDWWKVLAGQRENMTGRLGELIRCLNVLGGLLSQGDGDELEELALEINGHQQMLSEISEVLEQLDGVNDHERVVWLEKSPFLTLKSTPVEVSGILREKVFDRLSSAVLTSATMTIAGSFQHFLSDVGLDEDTLSMMVESPFDYDEQMRFFVVRDLFLSEHDYAMTGELAGFIAAVAERMEGRTLVLFTSHRLLQSVYSPLRDLLEQVNLTLLAQGLDGTRGSILEEFTRNSRSVLLGANSFWEGIDIPGAGLSCVILVKLPFWPPSLPLIEARSELLELKGKNSFYDLMLPEAIIRFKQGFGRLIRTKDDKGIVVLLDSRVLDKSYGRLFFSSLPVATHIRGEARTILHKIESWMADS